MLPIPWIVAMALQADGWYLRSDIIWAKPNPMPESVTDRPTKAHEYLFMLSKQPQYYYDAAAIAEPATTGDVRRPFGPGQVDERGNGHDRGGGTLRARGDVYTAKAYCNPQSAPRGPKSDFGEFERRNRRTVWTVATQPFNGAHFATFPTALIEPCILAGCPEGGTVLDPFGGAGTTGLVADRLHRNALLIEINPAYAEMARHRITGDAPLFAEVVA